MGQVCSCMSAGSVLMQAAATGDYITAQQILSVSPKSCVYRNLEGSTPLHQAAARGHQAFVQLLLETAVAHGKHQLCLNYANNKHQTPLMVACKYGHAECVGYLLNNGADATLTDSRRKNTCLHFASLYGRYDCIHSILNVRQNCPGQGRTTAVGSIMCKDALTGAQAKLVDCHNAWGLTVLHIAVFQGAINTVRTLLRHGASLEAVIVKPLLDDSPVHCAEGANCLHIAAQIGNVQVVRLLLECQDARGITGGPDLRAATDSAGLTPQQYAIRGRHTSLIHLLDERLPVSLLRHVWNNQATNATGNASSQQALASMLQKLKLMFNLEVISAQRHIQIASAILSAEDVLAPERRNAADIDAVGTEGEDRECPDKQEGGPPGEEEQQAGITPQASITVAQAVTAVNAAAAAAGIQVEAEEPTFAGNAITQEVATLLSQESQDTLSIIQPLNTGGGDPELQSRASQTEPLALLEGSAVTGYHSAQSVDHHSLLLQETPLASDGEAAAVVIATAAGTTSANAQVNVDLGNARTVARAGSQPEGMCVDSPAVMPDAEAMLLDNATAADSEADRKPKESAAEKERRRRLRKMTTAHIQRIREKWEKRLEDIKSLLASITELHSMMDKLLTSTASSGSCPSSPSDPQGDQSDPTARQDRIKAILDLVLSLMITSRNTGAVMHAAKKLVTASVLQSAGAETTQIQLYKPSVLVTEPALLEAAKFALHGPSTSSEAPHSRSLLITGLKAIETCLHVAAFLSNSSVQLRQAPLRVALPTILNSITARNLQFLPITVTGLNTVTAGDGLGGGQDIVAVGTIGFEGMETQLANRAAAAGLLNNSANEPFVSHDRDDDLPQSNQPQSHVGLEMARSDGQSPAAATPGFTSQASNLGHNVSTGDIHGYLLDAAAAAGPTQDGSVRAAIPSELVPALPSVVQLRPRRTSGTIATPTYFNDTGTTQIFLLNPETGPYVLSHPNDTYQAAGQDGLGTLGGDTSPFLMAPDTTDTQDGAPGMHWSAHLHTLLAQLQWDVSIQRTRRRQRHAARAAATASAAVLAHNNATSMAASRAHRRNHRLAVSTVAGDGVAQEGEEEGTPRDAGQDQLVGGSAFDPMGYDSDATADPAAASNPEAAPDQAAMHGASTSAATLQVLQRVTSRRGDAPQDVILGPDHAGVADEDGSALPIVVGNLVVDGVSRHDSESTTHEATTPNARTAPAAAASAADGSAVAVQARPAVAMRHIEDGAMRTHSSNTMVSSTRSPYPARHHSPGWMSKKASVSAASDTDDTLSEDSQHDNVCAICMELPVSVIVSPCEHGLCVQCALQLTIKGKESPACPFCRAKITAFGQGVAGSASSLTGKS